MRVEEGQRATDFIFLYVQMDKKCKNQIQQDVQCITKRASFFSAEFSRMAMMGFFFPFSLLSLALT